MVKNWALETVVIKLSFNSRLGKLLNLTNMKIRFELLWRLNELVLLKHLPETEKSLKLVCSYSVLGPLSSPPIMPELE